jgi:cobalamin biosynthesis protein CobW
MSTVPAAVAAGKIPCTIITGFLGAGKTTMIRNLLQNAGGRRLALIINEFGDVGVDGEILRNCGVENCPDENIVELSNGCICCTVADDFVPTLEKLLALSRRPEHIIIETSGLALPKPLVKAFAWPEIRNKVTVDGVVTVVDGPAVAAGQFVEDPEKVAAQRAADPSLDHDNPLEEVYGDQLLCADMIVLNKTDAMTADDIARVSGEIRSAVPARVKLVPAREGRVAVDVLLGLTAAAENDIANRPSCHDNEADHEHDDFDTFVVELAEMASPLGLIERAKSVAERFGVLRLKGYLAITGKPTRLLVQGVGTRFDQRFERAWKAGEARVGKLVVIGEKGIDRAGIEKALVG